MFILNIVLRITLVISLNNWTFYSIYIQEAGEKSKNKLGISATNYERRYTALNICSVAVALCYFCIEFYYLVTDLTIKDEIEHENVESKSYMISGVFVIILGALYLICGCFMVYSLDKYFSRFYE